MHNTRAALAAGVFAAALVSDFTGIRCPLGNGGHAFRVDFDWGDDPGASHGSFARATGSGTGVNTTPTSCRS
jgi:hypothetical protein